MQLQYPRKLDLTPLITHEFPFERAAEAYELLDEHPEQAGQIVLSFPEALALDRSEGAEARREKQRDEARQVAVV